MTEVSTMEPTEAEHNAATESTETPQPEEKKKPQRKGRAEPEPPPFFELVQKISPEDWARGFKIYCYRTWPVIDRRDAEHFLCKVSEPIDEDRLLRDFGSGKYFLRLNNPKGQTVASRTVSLHNPDFPPRVSPDEVVASDPRNETYFKVWGPKQRPAEATAGSDATLALAREILHGSESKSTLNEQVGNLYLETARARDELVGKMTSAQGNPAEIAMQTLDRVLAVAERLRPAAAPVPRSAKDELKETLELTNLMRENFGGGEAHPAGKAGSTLAALLPVVLPPLMPAVSNLLSALARNVAGAFQPPRPVAPPGAPTGPEHLPPGVLPAHSIYSDGGTYPRREAAPPPGALRQEAPPPMPEQPLPEPQQEDFIGQIGGLVLSALARDVHGADFAESFGCLYGGLAFEQLRNLGQETLVTMLTAHAVVGPQLAPFKERLQRFVAEFLSEEEEPAEPGEAEQREQHHHGDGPRG